VDNFIGQSSLLAIYPGDHEVCINTVLLALQNPEMPFQVNLRKPSIDGVSFYWTCWEFSALVDQDGQPIGVLCIGHDITDTQVEAQKAIEFAKRLDEVYEEISDGFYQLDHNWNFTKANKRALEVLGMSKESLIGENIWQLFGDIEGYQYPGRYRKAMEELTVVAFREYHPPLGKWFKTVASPAPEGLNVYFTDITNEMNQYQALVNAEKQLKAIYDSTYDIHLFIDLNFNILYFNKVAQEISIPYAGKNFEIGALFFDYFKQDDVEVFQQWLPEVLKGKVIQTEIKRQIKGSTFWLDLTYCPVYLASEMIGIGINLKDITQKKLAENRLIEQEYILNAIYNSTTEASSFIDTNYKIKYLNKVAKEINLQVFGKEAKVGDSPAEFIAPEFLSETLEKYSSAMNGEKVEEEIFDGNSWWHVSYTPVFNSDCEIIGIAHNVKDITDRKQKEIFINHQNQQLRQIAWIQSHELRRPVANILGLADLLKTEDLAHQQQVLENLYTSVNELDAKIHQIVKLSGESGMGEESVKNS
jgi:PAS domain S-box-containing protein